MQYSKGCDRPLHRYQMQYWDKTSYFSLLSLISTNDEVQLFFIMIKNNL